MKKQEFKTIRKKLTVSRKEYVTPHYIRIYLTGDDMEAFMNTTVGVNNKILIPLRDSMKFTSRNSIMKR